ncbi:hypothetical protein L1049_001533 [Liquidambar formosana]|uniref:MADS-box domain-containing protein n=1 Tax=Liquidambar formosana TaxID=63359 RepID=A0AAP0N868_LIQFO
MARKSKGRQKVEMAKMAKESNLQVTFSKRRAGLFKKASELCTLCGAEIAIIVFSPGKKAFSFGHPCVESIMDRFLTRNPSQNHSTTAPLVEAHRNASVRELNVQLTTVLSQLEAEKKRGEVLNQMRKASQTQCWWEAPIDTLGLQQIEQLRVSLEELKKNAAKQVDKLLMEASNPPSFFGTSTSIGGVVPFNAKATGLNASMMPPAGYNPAYGRGFF